ncbi:DoxX family membrane protein [Corynebacterium sp. 335C]
MIRKIARPMLASVFVADGVDTLMNRDDHVDGAQEVLNRVRTITPPQYASFVPKNPKTALTAVAGTKVAAGSLYALGKAPRVAATALVAAQVPTVLARHAFWETQDKEEKRNRRTGFLTNIGLLGGLFLATADTDGKPGLAWRAQDAGKRVNKKVQKALPTKSEAEARREELQARAADLGEKAKERAAVAREGAAEQLSTAKDYYDDNKDDWKDSITSFAADAREKLAEAAHNADLDKKAQKLGKRAEKARKRARKQAEKKLKEFRG